MWVQGTSAIVSALRGGIIAIFCALAILLAVIPAHAADDTAAGSMTTIEGLFTDGVDDESAARPDTMPGHGSGQFCGHVALLRPFTLATGPSSDEASTGPCLAPAHAWAPGPSELLAKPPRT
jgi:hypothetical protein